ncbi:RNA polymerase sigma factor [Candidatus Poribacteria bacterium]|nr:RNA polymerase sigma factor [Candidatus Poribacteria bacterium]MBT5710792.1 RNA polymerase sigma factor [Candidatus Poribacteria bacterium]MBT7100606.1 RNA polymerase sigma factor [Candidatus Poribacteria bacterium]MBT7808104.1 RNA polymerase sigma factor [Candidatus Poribacteria bacterium]
MHVSEDVRLVRRAMRGDRDAFEELARLHVTRVYALLVGLSRDRDVADEAFQETWLKVANRLHALRDPRAFRPWLYAVARNALRDVWRQRQTAERREAHDEEAATSDAGAEVVTPDVTASDVVTIVHVALARLPDRWRVAVTMRYMDDAPYAEIGAALGTTEDNARKLAQRGHDRLREHFARLGAHGDPSAILGSLAPTVATVLAAAIAALDAEAALPPPTQYAPATEAGAWVAYTSSAAVAVLVFGGVLVGFGPGRSEPDTATGEDMIPVYITEEKSVSEQTERLDVAAEAGWEWRMKPRRGTPGGFHGSIGNIVVFCNVVHEWARSADEPRTPMLVWHMSQSGPGEAQLLRMRPVLYDDAGGRHGFASRNSGAAAGDWGKVGWQSFRLPYADFVDAEYVYLGIETELGAGDYFAIDAVGEVN